MGKRNITVGGSESSIFVLPNMYMAPSHICELNPTFKDTLRAISYSFGVELSNCCKINRTRGEARRVDSSKVDRRRLEPVGVDSSKVYRRERGTSTTSFKLVVKK